MGINKRVTYEDTVLIMLEHDFFFKHHATYTINGCGHLVTVELTDILVTFWTKIVALIFMQTKVEFGTMLHHCHVER